ncbi:MAG: NADPH-dependent F420 reductase [Nitrososphaera sp.]|jgi:NADPH-dependent F420 reductase
MRIGIIGGTGGMGEGFALRWCLRHDIVIGSREAGKARDVAAGYSKAATEFHGSISGSISGDENIALAKDSDVLILSIPYETIEDTCSRLAGQVKNECIIVSPIVPMAKAESGFVYIPLERSARPAAELVAKKLPGSRVVAAYHTISEVKLKNMGHDIDADAFICGDDAQAVSSISALTSEIAGLRPIHIGPLSLSYQIEILTPMLLNAARRNKLKNPGLKLV